MDDTLIDFVGGLIDAVNLECGSSVSRDALSEWDIGLVLDPVLGEPWMQWLERRQWLWPTFKPMPGAFLAIEKWRSKGYEVELLTAKPKSAEWVVWKWLGNWRPPISAVTIVPLGANKATYSAARVLVDDNTRNVEQWSESGRWAVLYEAPWNAGVEGHLRAKDWREVERVVNSLVYP
jgi:5'(3')-deoxyribonucleotidase